MTQNSVPHITRTKTTKSISEDKEIKEYIHHRLQEKWSKKRKLLDEKQHKEEIVVLQQEAQEIHVPRVPETINSDFEKRKREVSKVTNKYEDVIMQLQEEGYNVYPSYVPSSCSNQDVLKERDHALDDAKRYRTELEHAREETKKIQFKMEERIGAVVNFWRNKIHEGDSRSGKIMKLALIK